MADINIYQVVHDVKEAYLDASGDTEAVKYGNIATKVRNMSGGVSGGYVVKFKVDDEDYYVASCQQGESITAPPNPTSQTGTFTAWQLNGVDVTFPYTPSADVELTAYFQNVRTEMEVYDANMLLISQGGSPYCYKSYDGKAICGRQSGSSNHFMTVAETERAADFSNWTSNGSITYDGDTYYYSVYNKGSSFGGTAIENFVDVGGTYSNDSAFAKAILDHYFYND